MFYVLIFIIGVAFGAVVCAAYMGLSVYGTLRIDHSDPYDDPYMFLLLDGKVEDISSQKFIRLKVDNKNFIPQK